MHLETIVVESNFRVSQSVKMMITSFIRSLPICNVKFNLNFYWLTHDQSFRHGSCSTLIWQMFDDIFDAVKGKLDEISTSVDDRLKEARENRSRSDSDQKSGLFSSFIELVDEANDTISKLLTEDKAAGPLQIGAPPAGALKPRNSTTRNSTGAGSSRSNLESDDDMYGYNLSDDESEDEDDRLGDMPTIKSHLRGSGDSNASCDDKKLNLTDLGGEPLPRYGLPSVYLKPSEVCQRRKTTTRRITEADLDENSPLYRHRDQILGQENQRKLSSSSDSKSGVSWVFSCVCFRYFISFLSLSLQNINIHLHFVILMEFQKHSCYPKKNSLNSRAPVATVPEESVAVFINNGGPRTKYTLARELIKSPRPLRKTCNNHNVRQSLVHTAWCLGVDSLDF